MQAPRRGHLLNQHRLLLLSPLRQIFHAQQRQAIQIESVPSSTQTNVRGALLAKILLVENKPFRRGNNNRDLQLRRHIHHLQQILPSTGHRKPRQRVQRLSHLIQMNPAWHNYHECYRSTNLLSGKK
jgi:hypothetical protein